VVKVAKAEVVEVMQALKFLRPMTVVELRRQWVC